MTASTTIPAAARELHRLKARVAELEAATPQSTRKTALGLAIRSKSMPDLLSISSAAWSSLRARGICPPGIRISEKGGLVFLCETVCRCSVKVKGLEGC
jgi:hypothetical protein